MPEPVGAGAVAAGARMPARRPWDRWGWAMGAVWVVFLAFPVVAVLDADLGTAATAVGLGALAAYALVYLHGLVRLPDDPAAALRPALVHLGLMVALIAVVYALAGPGALGASPFVVAMMMFALPWRLAGAVAAAGVLVPVLLVVTGLAEAMTLEFSLIVLLVAVATGLIRFLQEREGEHRRLEQELDLVAERERVARDVHDVLGHSLTLVSAKAELAERLVDVDPARSRAELAEIRSLTREALAEIRATVAGLRVARLGEELASARAALEAAGIEADVPDSVDEVDPRHRLVFAWVVREAVTNVVRHSAARHCRVTLSSRALSVVDDGRGATGEPEGNGLRGIRERLAAVGGRLEVGPGAGGVGTRLEVSL